MTVTGTVMVGVMLAVMVTFTRMVTVMVTWTDTDLWPVLAMPHNIFYVPGLQKL